MANGKGKVTSGLLDEPIAINSRADVNRARVLPLVRQRAQPKRPAVSPSAPVPAPAGDVEQPQGGFDYVIKRNRMLNRISGRAPRRNGTRRA